MKGTLLLTWRYLAHHRAKTTIMLAALTITFFLPMALHVAIGHYESELSARAKSTPLLIGATGNRYDLVLKSLYFSAETPASISMAVVDDIRSSSLADPIPLHIRFTASGKPLIGTSIDYFDFRNLRPASGSLPLLLGDCVLGAEVAADLGLVPGDRLLSDQSSLYNIASIYPLRMHVAGILAASGTPDDHAIFADIKTTWIIEGTGHGHNELEGNEILQAQPGKIVGSAAVREYSEISSDNLGSFHFHGPPESYPVTAAIALPYSQKAATILKARYHMREREQLLEPAIVIRELMGIVFRVKRFFDANFALVSLSTLLFLTLIILLSLRLRQREMATMFRIGCSHLTVFRLQAAEIAIILLLSLALAAGLAAILRLLAPRLVLLL
ncbi:MAG: putative ABC transport system permease protein [Rhodothermales bacterium]|jgi:putative ABC transport system permease protein